MFKLLRRILQRRGSKNATHNATAHRLGPKASTHDKRASRAVHASEWETVLTESFRRNCIAPSEETILHASDLYKRDLYGPLHVCEQQMARLHSEITAGFSHLQALMPLAIERALSRDPWEFAHIIEHDPEVQE